MVVLPVKPFVVLIVSVPVLVLFSAIEPVERAAAAEGVILRRVHDHGRGRERADEVDGGIGRAGVVERDGFAGVELVEQRDAVGPVEIAERVPVVGEIVAVPDGRVTLRGRREEQIHRARDRAAVGVVDGELRSSPGRCSRGSG